MSIHNECEVTFQLEDDNFKLPENEIILDFESRELKPHIPENSSTKLPAAYLSTCYDEFSRDFCTYTVAESAPDTVPVVDYVEVSEAAGTVTFPGESDANGIDKDQNSSNDGRKFLQHYFPCHGSWLSTFKMAPSHNSQLLSSGHKSLVNDCHIVFEITAGYGVKVEFEPVFANMALYTFVNDSCVRISESFHFSCTSPMIQQRFKDVYRFCEDDLPPEFRQSISQNFNSPNCCLFTLPSEMRKKEVFLVIQLTKVLSGDGALTPYQKGSVPTGNKHVESCSRLYQYRQPLGVAVLRVFDKSGQTGRRGQLKFPFFASKATINDYILGQVGRV